jgi:Phospholipid methyltransferase
MIAKNVVKQPQQISYQILESVLAMSGILINKVTSLRLVVILLIVLNIGLVYFFHDKVTLIFAIGFFVVMFIVRYWLLFGSFGENGLAQKLTARYGEDRAYAYYEAVTAFLFFYRSTSLNLLIEQTSNTLNIPYMYNDVIFICGWAMMIGATIINVWATMIIGIDVYYYKDMFVSRPLGNFEVKGPFRYFSNPMYGIGQFNGYGLALISGSLWGLLATLLNQVVMYIFYFLYEKPHIMRVFGNGMVYEKDLVTGK